METMTASTVSLVLGTLGRVEMFDSTLDGRAAFVNPTTGDTNIKGKKILDVKVHDVRTRSLPGKFKTMG